MRICFISIGIFGHIAAYLNYFKSAGHDVRFISLSPSPEHGVPTYNVGLGTKYSRTVGKWKYPLSMLRVRPLVRKLKPDIVHTHYVTSGGLTGLVCGFHPIVTTAHGGDLTVGIKKRFWRLLLKAIFNHSDCINTVSEDLKEKVISLGISPEKICVLTLGIDTEKFSFAQRKTLGRSKTLKLVTTRAQEAIYDHPTIVKALAILQSKGVDFQMVFVGSGSLMNQLKQQVRQEQLSERVTFLGRVDNDKLPQILHQNDIYISASHWDGTSLCLLEAMATGLFPVVSDIKANSAWLEDGVDGFLHKVGDANELANYILKALENPRLVSSALQRNRKRVVKSGDTKTNMKLLERIYEELIEKQCCKKARR